jgi:uncharacterized phage-like protein YoqJ
MNVVEFPIPWNKTVAFTGHRPDKLGGYDENNHIAMRVKFKLCLQILQAIDDGYTHFISGGAIGVDQWAAWEVLNLRDDNNDIKLIIAKPFPSQDSKWPLYVRQDFQLLLKAADLVVNVSPDPYSASKMQIRNEWMVDHTKRIIAVWDGSPGGTGNCVNYINKKGNRELIVINPNKED